MKRYFDIKSSVNIQINKNNTRKDKIITKPLRLYVLTESTVAFYEEIGFEGNKQKHLKALLNR